MNFKKIIILILSVIVFSETKAQSITEVSQNWTSYFQKNDISSKSGLNFRVSVAIKMENVKNNSNAALWVRIDKKDGKVGFFKNNLYEIKVTNQWKVYEITGEIDKEADKINIGAYAENFGEFYFDEFKLEVKNTNGKWKTLKLDNSGFENNDLKNDLWKNGIGKEKVAKTFSTEYVSKNPYKGKSCLLIKGGDVLGSSSKGKTVDVNGVSLYYEIYGEGEPLLLLHGNGQSIYAFKEQVEEYAKHYKVIIVDCRGRGNSTYQNDVELTFDVEIEDLKQFLDKINIEKTHIVGWSDGGILGILMAIKHPEKVDKMVSMAGNIFPDGMVNKEELLDYVKQFQELNTNHQYDRDIEFIYLDYKYPNLEYEELKVITSKCLIMAGDKDEIKTEHTVKIFENIPNAQLAIVPNATHYLPRDNPKLFNEIVLRFLKEE